jgi:hypothetical protein
MGYISSKETCVFVPTPPVLANRPILYNNTLKLHPTTQFAAHIYVAYVCRCPHD